MVCSACKRSSSTDCFIDALETIKQHYMFYKNALSSRDVELQSFKDRNEQLNKALEFLQKQQQPHKKFKGEHNENHFGTTQTKICNRNNNSIVPLSDLSITTDEDDADVASENSASNLNMALNSEQLFETSVISPAKPPPPAPAEPIQSSSEKVISPRAKLMPRRNKQRGENSQPAKERQALLEKSKSEIPPGKDTSSQPANKSWAMAFLKPSTFNSGGTTSKVVECKVGINRKPDKRVNLSLKKVNPSKVKQTILPFNTSRDSSVIESDICDDVIDASPVPTKASRSGKSWAHRSHQGSSSPTNNNSQANLKIEDSNNNQKPNETVDSIPIENIVFDFSPSKKSEPGTSSSSSPHPRNQLKAKQLDFHNNTTDCLALADDDQTTMMTTTSSGGCKSGDSSSVVILTPATQDIIFLDDTAAEFGDDINTLDLLADVQKRETEYLENLRRYESKSIEKQLKQEAKQSTKPPKEEKKHNFIKPVALIKKEKHSENLDETKDKSCLANDIQASTSSSSSKKPKFQNPLLDDEPSEEDEEEDVMPKPIIVKTEPLDKRKLSLKERFNIDCEECEKLLRLLPPTLSDREIEMHLDKCKYHNRLDYMRQNTPDNFWNPFILSFDENDPRNEILIDTRFKDKKGS
ncbi:CTBP-interacting protein [Musca autumnalis]|uniref:CTBP-interacting protein n=1 Tax=Musca autumnalis TaxID=221902 RepID=UPI003CF92F1D